MRLTLLGRNTQATRLKFKLSKRDFTGGLYKRIDSITAV